MMIEELGTPVMAAEKDSEVSTPTPRKHIDSKPLPTDSLVTIRLSDLSRASAAVEDSGEDDNGLLDESHTPFDRELKKSRTASILVLEGIMKDELQHALDGKEDDDCVSETGAKGDKSTRTSSNDSEESLHVDWEMLDKAEEKEDADAESDEQTSLLLARLEQENNALSNDPKSGLNERRRTQTRPPSVYQLKKLVQEQGARSVRFSLLPAAAPMTELDFWAALVQDYAQTAQRLPTVTSNKIRGGVPAPLRGVVWTSMAGARDANLEDQFDRLGLETSPYETIINKDIGRSFPGVAMFRDADGEGQRMLACVLKCYSLYDKDIGYCQGLGFLVGPLLMNMGEKQAFCVLARLMDDYDLRSCFLPNLSGLHLRIYQFQRLLHQHLPELADHLDKLDVSSAYLSPWFLSFFATTCPLPLLFRIYDVIFAEGASETLMRVALAIMRRNQKKLLSFTEMEDAMQLLLSRALWDPYGLSATSADELVSDFVSFTGVVDREALQALEASFKEEAQSAESTDALSFFPAVQQAASRFLNRKLFTYSHSTPAKASTSSSSTSQSLTPGLSAPNSTSPSRPTSLLTRTASKQSLATLYSNGDSTEGSTGTASTAITEITDLSLQHYSVDAGSMRFLKSPSDSIGPNSSVRMTLSSNKDKDLHVQIEDLLLALTDLQREHASLAIQLEREREERKEDQEVVKSLVENLKQDSTRPSTSSISHRRNTISLSSILTTAHATTTSAPHPLSPRVAQTLEIIESRFTPKTHHRTPSNHDTKTQLRLNLANCKQQLHHETTRNADLNRQILEKENEAASLRDELQKSRTRMKNEHLERERLQKMVHDLRQASRENSRGRTASVSSQRSSQEQFERPRRSETGDSTASTLSTTGPTKGLREFRLGRVQPPSLPRTKSETMTPPPRRSSSLAVSTMPNGDNGSNSNISPAAAVNTPMSISPNHAFAGSSSQIVTGPPSPAAADEALLQELVSAKTAEAVARSELEELRNKFEQMKRTLAVTTAAAAANANPSATGTPLSSTLSGTTSSSASTFSRNRAGSTSSAATSAETGLSRSSTTANFLFDMISSSSSAATASSPSTPPIPGTSGSHFSTGIGGAASNQTANHASSSSSSTTTVTPGAGAGWSVPGVGGGGGFFGWGKRSTSTAMPSAGIEVAGAK